MTSERAALAVALMFVLVWGVPWLVDMARLPSRVTYFSRRLRTGMVGHRAGFKAASLQCWATAGALLVVATYVGLGWIAGMGSSASSRWPLAMGLILFVGFAGTLRPFGMGLGLLRYEDDVAMYKLSSIWSGNGPLNLRMLMAWGLGFLLRYVGLALTLAAVLMITSANDLVPVPFPGFGPIRDSPAPKWVWIIGYVVVGRMVASFGEWLRDLVLLVRRRGTMETEAPRTSGPFVVLLRSFGDDATKVVTRRLGPESFSPLAAATPRRRRYLEDVLGWSLRSVGPIVAVADPRPSASGGSSTAERVVLGDEWQAVVRDLLERAQLVVAIVGRTPGVRWELHQIASKQAHARTVFVFPPDDAEGSRARLKTLRDAFGLAASVNEDDEPDGAPPVLAAVIKGDSLEVVRTGADEEIDYRAAIAQSRLLLGI